MLGIAVWLASCSVQDQFPDVPDDRWWFYEGIHQVPIQLPISGLIFDSRREMAGWTQSALQEVLKLVEAEKSPELRISFIRRHRGMVPFFDRATRRLSRELLDMDPTWKDKMARLRPFLDVPKGHWAAESVGDLKVLGLISGYPDGKFRG